MRGQFDGKQTQHYAREEDGKGSSSRSRNAEVHGVQGMGDCQGHTMVLDWPECEN